MAKRKDKTRNLGPTGANHLLAIAINEYEHHSNLANCVRDAGALVKVLQEKYGFRPEETTTLFDNDATNANLYQSLLELSDKVKPQDSVLIYFSGHGFYDPSDQTGHLVPVDAPEGAVWQYFSNANLVNRIRAINSLHTFLVVDSCFSGSLFKAVNTRGRAKKARGLPSRWALAAGRIEEVEDGRHGGNSPFAKGLLTFLQNNSAPMVTASKLIQEVKDFTANNARQTPVGGVLFKTGHVGGEFVFYLRQDEASAWAEAQQKNTPDAYRQFLESHPDSRFAQEARQQLNQMGQAPPSTASAGPLDNLPLPADILPPDDAPFVGLDYFTRREARVFFGRNDEILKLHSLLTHPFTRLALLFGQSGVGKSSLLFAGLLPRMEQGWDILSRRRTYGKGLAKDLEELLDVPRKKARRLILLDQAEEMFTNPNPKIPYEKEALAQQLGELLPGDGSTRIILSFRMEYLALVEELLKEHNLPYRDRMLLKPLSQAGIKEALQGPATDPNLAKYRIRLMDVDDGDPKGWLSNLIATELGRDKDDYVAPLLQAVLRKMWDRAPQRKDKNGNTYALFDEALYRSVKSDSMAELLKDQLKELAEKGEEWKKVTESGLALSLLNGFITDEVTAGERTEAELLQDYPDTAPDVISICTALKALFLLSEPPERDTRTFRLAHDALAPVIRKRFNDSDAPGQRAWRILENKLIDLEKGLKPTLLNQEDLRIVEAGLAGMQAVPTLEPLLEESRKKHEEARQRDASFIKSICDNADEKIKASILELDYSGAMKTLKGIFGLGHQREVFLRHLQEVVFWWISSGNPKEALAALKTPIDFKPEGLSWLEQEYTSLQDGAGDWMATLKRLDEANLVQLQHRYYQEMVHVEGGAFMMGEEKEEHKLTVSNFSIARTPTTVWQYALYCAINGLDIMEHEPGWGLIGDNPMMKVNWYDALEYANWLSQIQGNKPYYSVDKSRKDPKNKSDYDDSKYLITPDENSNGFRLPTEAEWEYAARGGQEGKNNHFTYAGSNEVDEVAWTSNNARSRTQPVMQKKANDLGLFDMSGNVWEWCWDWYDKEYYKKSNNAHDPQGPDSGSSRVLRGGSWLGIQAYARCAYRNGYAPGYRYSDFGFRLARTGGP